MTTPPRRLAAAYEFTQLLRSSSMSPVADTYWRNARYIFELETAGS